MPSVIICRLGAAAQLNFSRLSNEIQLNGKNPNRTQKLQTLASEPSQGKNQTDSDNKRHNFYYN
jgi:hypothetical protein